MTLIGTPVDSLEVDPMRPGWLPQLYSRAQREKRGSPPNPYILHEMRSSGCRRSGTKALSNG
jgi:hypothetical protein